MFCSKCGTQLPDGSTFCSTCGASQGKPQNAPAPRPAGALKFRTPDFKDKKTLFYCIAAGLAFLAFIFSLTGVIKVSALGMSESGTLGECDCGWVLVFVVIFALASIAASALLALFDLPENIKKYCKFAAPGGALLAFLFFLVGVLIAKGKFSAMLGGYSSYLGDLGVKIGMSFIGWVTILFFLGAAGLTGYVLYTENFKKPAAPTV